MSTKSTKKATKTRAARKGTSKAFQAFVTDPAFEAKVRAIATVFGAEDDLEGLLVEVLSNYCEGATEHLQKGLAEMRAA